VDINFEVHLGELRYLADVVVVGGGPTGFCAAVAAARTGAKTMLVEQGNCCGGMATMGLVGPFMTCYDKEGRNMIIKGLFQELVDRMVARDGAIHPSKMHKGTAYTSWIKVGHDGVTPFSPEIMKLVMDEMLLEAGVQILYHTTFVQPVIHNDDIKGIMVFSKSGFQAIGAGVVIDCTGDGDVAARAGVPFHIGNERLGTIQPASMFFRICDVDSEKVEEDILANIHNFYRKAGVNYRSFHWRVSEARKAGDWALERVAIGMFKSVNGEWCINTSRIMDIDATDNKSLTRGEIEGRRQVAEIFAFIKKYIPGCENAKLMASGSTLGIRESRHIKGEYCMELEDVLKGRVPADSVAIAANSVDVHGRFGPRSNEYLTIENGQYYGIPYGCLLPQGVEQLLVAGRSVSASSEAAGAIRVMPPVMAMGQAAGTAAALAVHENCVVRNVNIRKLQETLVAQGAYLPFV
jgi:hypothetical protein